MYRRNNDRPVLGRRSTNEQELLDYGGKKEIN
jgi:hypothetical protein